MLIWDLVTRRKHLHGWSVPPRNDRTSCNFLRCIPSSIRCGPTHASQCFFTERTSRLEQQAAAPTWAILRISVLAIVGLAGGGFGASLDGFAVIADDADERLGGAGEAAVPSVNKAKLAPKVDIFDGEQLHFASFDIVFCKTLTDKRDTGIRSDEALDHPDAGQLHGDVNARAIGAEKFVEHLAGETGARKNKRLLSDFGEGDLGAMGERVLGADHEAQTVLVNVVHLQIGGLDGQGDDANIDGAVLDALQNLVAEIAIDTDVHQGIAALKFRKNIGEQVKTGGFIGAEDHRALNHVTAVSNDLNGFVSQAEEFFGVLEKNFTGGSQLDGFGRAVQKPGFVGLLKLANLGTDGGLRAEHFLARARKALQFGDKDKSSELVEVHGQNAWREL